MATARIHRKGAVGEMGIRELAGGIYGFGLCECGCGGKTNLATKTSRAEGYVKGRPVRFLRGHHNHLPVWERLLENIELSADGCWLWTRPLNASGYGFLKIHGKEAGAHRASYETFVGPIPDDLETDHLCRVRHCINFEHLEPVTTRENNLRGVGACAQNARVTHCPEGHEYTDENTGRNKGARYCRECNRTRSRKHKAERRRAEGRRELLKPEDVLTIRELHKNGVSKAGLAIQFGCTRSNINYIVSGRSWSHLLEVPSDA